MSEVADQNLKLYATREPVILLVLTAVAVVSFLAVSGLSRFYHARQAAQAEKWFRRGVIDQKKGYLKQALTELEAAQLYSPGNFDYELTLAQTLGGLGRVDEAYSYLLNLHEQQPESGTINLELARIAAKKGDTAAAIRYFHNALYANWPPDSEDQRQTGRLELIEFLLGKNDNKQAQSELIALAANLTPNTGLHTHIGDLFFQAQDYEHALAQYQNALKVNAHDTTALRGIGLAAFELGRYGLAQRYLQTAIAETPDPVIDDLLKTSKLVLKMDPFIRQIPMSQRHQIVINAFATAGERLNACPLPATEQPSLDMRWKVMKPQVTVAGLKKNPDLIDTAMNLVFAIEQAASVKCGEPTGKDRVLLLVSRLHEGGDR